MQTSMLFLGRASSRKQRSIWSQKLDTTYRFFWHTWHADKICEFHQVKAKIFVVGHFWKSSSIMFCTNRRARWINLVWNTIIIRTERTGNSKTCFQTCCDQLLDSSQEQKKSMSSCRVLLPFYKHFTEKSLKKNCCNIKQKYGSECTHSGDVQWIGKPCDFSEFMVIDKNDSVQSS